MDSAAEEHALPCIVLSLTNSQYIYRKVKDTYARLQLGLKTMMHSNNVCHT